MKQSRVFMPWTSQIVFVASSPFLTIRKFLQSQLSKKFLCISSLSSDSCLTTTHCLRSSQISKTTNNSWQRIGKNVLKTLTNSETLCMFKVYNKLSEWKIRGKFFKLDKRSKIHHIGPRGLHKHWWTIQLGYTETFRKSFHMLDKSIKSTPKQLGNKQSREKNA